MEIAKQIQRVRISERYRPFVDLFVSEINRALGPRLHSIYMCGSIPKGEARPLASDADFTLVLRENPTEYDLREINPCTIPTQVLPVVDHTITWFNREYATLVEESTRRMT